jgi:sepiapterin reductase
MHFLLIARDEQQLLSLKQEVESPKVTVDFVSGSLQDKATHDRLEVKLLDLNSQQMFQQVILINNAGSLGEARYLTSDYSAETIPFLQDYFAFNLTSFIAITGSFLHIFSDVVNRVVVNISSLVAIGAIRGMSVYGAGKAARDAFIRSIALEYPGVTAINYAPGPVQTDMADQLKKASHVEEFYSNPSNLLKAEDTVEKLVKLLKKEFEFENGAHIDYFDIP